ncbi:MAG: 4Fe-4S binding protein [Chloroflexota bacterium]
MADLSVELAGIKFKNPISIASHAPAAPWAHWAPDRNAPEIQMKVWRKYYEADVGSLTTGTVYFEDIAKPAGGGRFWAASTPGFAKREGFISAATIPDAMWSRTNGLEALRRAKKEFTDMRLIASIIVAGIDPAVWAQLALECEQAGADMVELNCGSVMFIDTVAEAKQDLDIKDKIPAGVTIGEVPEVVAAIVKGIKQKVKIPVAVKLTPEMSFFRLYSAIPVYQEAGVAAVIANHTFMSVVPPDIYNRGKTTFPGMKTTTWWSTNGPWHRFACYRNVAMLGKFYPEMETIACGGLVTPEQCVEIMMLGAKKVQLSAGIFWNGLGFPEKVVKFLKKYMDEQGYRDMNELRGIGLPYIVEMEECQRELKAQIGHLVANVNLEACKGTEKCDVCLDTWCSATYEENGYPRVDPELCASCYLCVIRCPHGARYMEEI